MAEKLYNKLKRLYLVVNKLRSSPASKSELLNLLQEHGLSIEVATFERDKKTLKEDFGIQLVYDAHLQKYKLEEMDDRELAQLIQFLQFNQLSQALNANLSSSVKLLDYIDFENETLLKGIEHLHQLIVATKNQLTISFKHYSFQSQKTHTITLNPYLLKQYQSRWYVVGQTSYGAVRTFGIDRISELEVSTDHFTVEKLEIREKFSNCVGISAYAMPKELVQISFEISQKPYLNHLPLHASQKLIDENENEVIYEYHVINNFEFRQHILKYGAMAKVRSPKSLVKQIQKELSRAFKNYS